jgi:hypothetical protein
MLAFGSTGGIMLPARSFQVSEASGRHNLITGGAIEDQIAQAADIEASKSFYSHQVRDEIRRQTAERITRIHEALQRAGEPFCLFRYGKKLTLGNLSGEGLRAVRAEQDGHMVSPRIVLEFATELTTEECDINDETAELLPRDEPFELPYYSSATMFEDEASASEALTGNAAATQCSLFIGRTAVTALFDHLTRPQPPVIEN